MTAALLLPLEAPPGGHSGLDQLFHTVMAVLLVLGVLLVLLIVWAVRKLRRRLALRAADRARDAGGA